MGKNVQSELFDSLKEFSESVTAKFKSRTRCEPEAQLKAPLEQLIKAYGKQYYKEFIIKSECRQMVNCNIDWR